MAEGEAPEAQPAEAGDIFSRLAKRKAAPPRPPPPPVDAAMVSTDVAMGDASMGDASMGDAAMAEAALADNALAEAAFPDERPRKKLNVVPIGWTVLGLFIALVLGTLIFAQGTVLSILPGAARLYGLFGLFVHGSSDSSAVHRLASSDETGQCHGNSASFAFRRRLASSDETDIV